VIIDVHGHLSAPPEVYAYKGGLLAHHLHPNSGIPEVTEDRMREYGEGHIRQLRELGIDVQILSPRPYQAMHSIDVPAIMVEWNKYINDMIARHVEMFPETFLGMAGLPQSPGGTLDEALKELDRCVNELGFVGCMVNPDPGEGAGPTPPGLGDPFWYPLYERCVRYGVPLMVHAAACKSPRESYSLHFINEETIAIASLIEGRVLDRFPELNIIIPHGGGAIPYQLGRFDAASVRHNEPRFKDELKRLWFDTAVYTEEGLELLLKVVSPERCLLGTERPGIGRVIRPEDGTNWDDIPFRLNKIDWLKESDKEAVLGKNAASIFPVADRAMKPSR
jgi:Predicted metal-dependent hydrolase of the TIM-barrel fold